jgi:copper homeostasis protein
VAPILLEICCGSLDDALQAAEGGADRVELCAAMLLGGLTPSIGTIVEAARLLEIPFLTMIRPRGGGFAYSRAEFAAMERDVELALDAGSPGVVLGVLRDDGSVDAKRTARLIKRAGGADVVFHRAFDVTPDPFAALETLIDLGCRRVLTSGQRPTVLEGAALIRDLIERADGGIEILPGGGVEAWNVRECIERTGCDQIHLTAWRTMTDRSTDARPAITFGGALRPSERDVDVTDAALVREIRDALGA